MRLRSHRNTNPPDLASEDETNEREREQSDEDDDNVERESEFEEGEDNPNDLDYSSDEEELENEGEKESESEKEAAEEEAADEEPDLEDDYVKDASAAGDDEASVETKDPKADDYVEEASATDDENSKADYKDNEPSSDGEHELEHKDGEKEQESDSGLPEPASMRRAKRTSKRHGPIDFRRSWANDVPTELGPMLIYYATKMRTLVPPGDHDDDGRHNGPFHYERLQRQIYELTRTLTYPPTKRNVQFPSLEVMQLFMGLLYLKMRRIQLSGGLSFHLRNKPDMSALVIAEKRSFKAFYPQFDDKHAVFPELHAFKRKICKGGERDSGDISSHWLHLRNYFKFFLRENDVFTKHELKVMEADHHDNLDCILLLFLPQFISQRRIMSLTPERKLQDTLKEMRKDLAEELNSNVLRVDALASDAFRNATAPMEHNDKEIFIFDQKVLIQLDWYVEPGLTLLRLAQACVLSCAFLFAAVTMMTIRASAPWTSLISLYVPANVSLPTVDDMDRAGLPRLIICPENMSTPRTKDAHC